MPVTEKPKGKHPGGRPSKYKPEFCEALLNFFRRPRYEDVKLPHYKDGKLVWEDIKRMPNELPSMEGFEEYWNKNHPGKDKIDLSTIYRWADEKHPSYQPKFCEAFIRAKKYQKMFLIQNGLLGLYNPLFAKFVAVNISDMRDKTEQEHGVSDDLKKALDHISSILPKPK